MSQYQAVFEIDSNADAYAARRLAEQVYNTCREELREVRGDDTEPNETLQALEAIRDAARHPTPGTLTIIYEQHDEGFDS